MKNKILNIGKILTKFEKFVSPNFRNVLAEKCRLFHKNLVLFSGYIVIFITCEIK